MVNDNVSKNFISELIEAPRCTYIVAFTDENMFKGYIPHAVSERFLDVLNQGSIVDPVNSTSDFLRLTDVEVCTLDGVRKETAANCLLSRNSILVVAENQVNSCELPPPRPFRYTLFQRKKPITVNIRLLHLNITGQVYINESEQSILALDTEQIFLPVTNGILTSVMYSSHTEFEFIAVKKDRIISILELSSK